MWKHTKRKKEGGGQKYVTYIRKIVWVLFKDVTIEVALRDNAPRVFSLLLHAISPLSYLSLSLSLPSNAPPSLSLPLPSSRSLPCRSSLSSSHPPGEKAWLRERLEAANATKSSVARGLRSGAPRFLARGPLPAPICPCLLRPFATFPIFRAPVSVCHIEDAWIMGRPPVIVMEIGHRLTGKYLPRSAMLAIVSFTMLAVIAVANPFLEAAQGNSFICRFMSLRQFYDCRAIKKREKDQRKEEEEKKKVFLEVDSSPRLCGGVIDKSLFFFFLFE